MSEIDSSSGESHGVVHHGPHGEVHHGPHGEVGQGSHPEAHRSPHSDVHRGPHAEVPVSPRDMGVHDAKVHDAPVHDAPAHDVVVIGGGPAGMSAAIALARAGRSVMVIDSGSPRNAAASHMHNVLGNESIAPADLLADARTTLAGYGGSMMDGAVEDISIDRGFQVRLADGSALTTRRVLVATGLTDELPNVPGIAEQWGRGVLHCPYCHGFEVRDRRIGVLATGPLAADQALLWRQWSADTMLFLHEQPSPEPAMAERLAARAIPVVTGQVERLEVAADTITGVRLADGELVPVDALVIAPRMTARGDLLASLGLKPVDVEQSGHVIGSQIPADPSGATAVPGVWVAGNVGDVRAQVIGSAASGLAVAAALNHDLVVEDTDLALATYRAQREALFTEAAWEERYRAREAVWSGNPNPQLVAEVSGARPGRALDVGCGEGADAVWLAKRGWRVTAVDIATTALDRAAAHAADAGVGEAIDFRHADLRAAPPEARSYDLVTSQFMQLPPEERRDLFATLAAAVAPGGLLLIVGHHPNDMYTTAHRMHFPDRMFTAEQIAADLDPAEWAITTETRPRSVTDPEGRSVTIRDAVLAARRR